MTTTKEITNENDEYGKNFSFNSYRVFVGAVIKLTVKLYVELQSVATCDQRDLRCVDTHTWAGQGSHTGNCIVLCVVRNAGVQYLHLLHPDRLRYSHW